MKPEPISMRNRAIVVAVLSLLAGALVAMFYYGIAAEQLNGWFPVVQIIIAGINILLTFRIIQLLGEDEKKLKERTT